MKYIISLLLLLFHLSAAFLYSTARPNAEEVKLIERRKKWFFFLQKPSTVHNLISHPSNAHCMHRLVSRPFFFLKIRAVFSNTFIIYIYIYIYILFVRVKTISCNAPREELCRVCIVIYYVKR